jgi:hypothetical protein
LCVPEPTGIEYAVANFIPLPNPYFNPSPHLVKAAQLNTIAVAQIGWPHFGVAGGGRALETFALAGTGSLHAVADGFGLLDRALIGQLLIIDARNFDMNVDAV